MGFGSTFEEEYLEMRSDDSYDLIESNEGEESDEDFFMQNQESKDMYDLVRFYNELDNDQVSEIREDSGCFVEEFKEDVEGVSFHLKKKMYEIIKA